MRIFPVQCTKTPRAYSEPSCSQWFAIGLVMSFVLLVILGWNLFWFLTDDAFIAFRYVSNRQLGLGYVWNPPPFRPVEGYTSFLWLLILDATWSITGIEPPESANWLCLGFALLSFIFAAIVTWKILSSRFEYRTRLVILALSLALIVTNRTWITWTSSGLETSLFNLLQLAWVLTGFAWCNSASRTALPFTICSALLCLTRPDGLLYFTAALSVLLLGFWFGRNFSLREIILGGGALLLVPAHLIWRLHTYGELLPNTYFAKYVEPWPESGIRYLGSFVLKYALWIWILFPVSWFVCISLSSGQAASWRELAHKTNLLKSILAVTVVAHVLYYVVVIGGDHFEYRVFSGLIPLLVISAVGIGAHSIFDERSAAKFLILGLTSWLLASWPIPYLHLKLSVERTTRAETFMMAQDLESSFPALFAPYARGFDSLQRWLIAHFVCMRHQEHKVFWRTQETLFSRRRILDEFPGNPVYSGITIGVPSWILARVPIIDGLGLNDYVVARNKPDSNRYRIMAHERRPPEGYVECFRPNVLLGPSGITIQQRAQPLSDMDIMDCERKWRTN